ncbi:36714_t:CDS:1, partial [Racocetra persica]
TLNILTTPSTNDAKLPHEGASFSIDSDSMLTINVNYDGTGPELFIH